MYEPEVTIITTTHNIATDFRARTEANNILINK